MSASPRESTLPRAAVSLPVLLLAVLGLIAAVLLPGDRTASAQPAAVHAVVAPGASTAHPYSSPIWWPLGAASGDAGRTVYMGCFKANPGCRSPKYHTNWLLDISGRYGTDSASNHQKVYAMGAGIVHIGASGQGCRLASTRGNYVSIYHGGGVTSYYAHLSKHLLVQNGEYVTARTPLGYLGNTGNANCRINPGTRYTMVAIKHDRTYVNIPHLYACVNGQTQQWPRDISKYTQWNQLPLHFVIPDTDAGRSCAASPPATATHPSRVSLRRSAHGALRSRWSAPAAGYRVSQTWLVLQIWYKSDHAWFQYRTKTVPGTRTTAVFGHLKRHHHFRVQVEFHNNAGFSAPSGWHYRTTPR